MLAVFAVAMVAVTLWGATPIVTKIAVLEMPAEAVGLLRVVVAAAVTGPALVLFFRVPRPQGARQIGLVLVAVGGGFIAFPLLFSLGVARTSASHAGLILAALPLWTGMLGTIIERSWPRWTWFVGAAVALTGEILLIGFDPQAEAQGATLSGDLLVALGGICASSGHVAGARLAPRFGTWSTALFGITLGGLILLPVTLWSGAATTLAEASLTGWWSIGFLAAGSTLLAFVAWYWALGRGGIARVGALQFAQPVITLFFATLLLGEPLTAPLVVATLIILTGVAFTQRSGRRRPAPGPGRASAPAPRRAASAGHNPRGR